MLIPLFFVSLTKLFDELVFVKKIFKNLFSYTFSFLFITIDLLTAVLLRRRYN